MFDVIERDRFPVDRARDALPHGFEHVADIRDAVERPVIQHHFQREDIVGIDVERECLFAGGEPRERKFADLPHDSLKIRFVCEAVVVDLVQRDTGADAAHDLASQHVCVGLPVRLVGTGVANARRAQDCDQGPEKNHRSATPAGYFSPAVTADAAAIFPFAT